MKNLTLLILTLGCFFKLVAQTPSVEKSIYGIQTGILGVWIHNEAKLTNHLVLRSEIGLDAGLFSGRTRTGFLLTPVLTLEPRWYYNLERRVSKNKSILHNSGNFLSLNIKYHPDIFVISNEDDITVPNQISIVPTWGLRRNLGEHFNYELGFGIGYHKIFNDDFFYRNDGELTANLHLRIGYKF